MVLALECPKRAFRPRLGRRFLKNLNVIFTTKNLQLVYPPLWEGPFNENPYTKLRLGRSKAATISSREDAARASAPQETAAATVATTRRPV